MLYYKVQTQGPSPVVVRLRSKLDIKMYRLKMKKKDISPQVQVQKT